MKKSFRGLGVVLCALAPLGAAAQFEARDLNGDGSVDAYYSPTQGISWAADANLYATQGLPTNYAWYSVPGHQVALPPGELRWTNAVNFVGDLTIAGVDGWRLPQRLLPTEITHPSGCPAALCNFGLNAYPSELSFMATLLQESNPFLNVQSGLYVTNTAGTRFQEARSVLNPNNGVVSDENMTMSGHAWAVFDGDVGVHASVSPVPEPSTYALLSLGVLGVVLRRRQASKRP